MSEGGKDTEAGRAAGDTAPPAGGPLASEEDLSVVNALRRGDEQAFAHLVDQHQASLRRIARFYVSSPSVAEEVVQDTWLGVIEGVWAFEGRSSLKTWITCILVNRAKTRGVREKRTIPFAALGPGDLEAPGVTLHGTYQGASSRPQSNQASTVEGSGIPAPRDPGPSPEAGLLAKEASEHLKRAIDALPENLRIVLTMRDVEGFSSEEVCNVLGIRETHQRVLLHRARSKVRAVLQPYLGRG
jgi:RNA polymerase sigma-70 factor, ECF subfamily